jgi:hypothetical protein
MDCKECRANLSELVDKRLEAVEAAAIEAHVARCLGCSEALADFRTLNSVMVEALPELEAPSARMWKNIQAQLPVREPVRENVFARAFRTIFSNGLVLAPVPVALLIVAAYWSQPAPQVAKEVKPGTTGTAVASSPQQRQIRQAVDDKRIKDLESNFQTYAPSSRSGSRSPSADRLDHQQWDAASTPSPRYC